MNIGLFFGSFNPIHNGHLMLAQYMANFANVDEVWFVVSPQNPFKQDKTLADASHRVEMVRRAVANTPYLKVCDIELSLPLPSYTVNTLAALNERYPTYTFSLIMGGDNLPGLPRWYKSEDILSHRIIVYPRPGFDLNKIISESEALTKANIVATDAPQIEISSTMLRQWIKENHSIEHFTPHAVASYIKDNDIY